MTFLVGVLSLRRGLLSMVWLLLMGFVIVAIASEAEAQADKPLVIAQGIDALTLDVQNHANIPTLNITRNIFDSLLRRDAKLNIVPHLVTSYARRDDTTWELKLRQGVSFHNGEPFDAAAVKFSIQRILSPGSKSPQKGWINTIERVEVIDGHTINLVTSVPDPVLPARLTLMFVVPPKYIAEKGDAQFSVRPVGTGPYRLVEWVKDDRLVLEANRDYWAGAPKIKRVVFRGIPEAQSRLAALQTREADIIVNVPPDLSKVLESTKETRVDTVPGCRVIYVALPTLKEGPLRDKRVRQAINYAVDVQAIVDRVLGGHGTRVATPVPPLAFGFDPTVPLYPYDPEKAKQLLAAAGFPQGLDLALDTPSGRYLMDKDVAEAVSGQLAKSGIRVKVRTVEHGIHSKNITSHQVTGMYLLGWCLPSLDPDTWVWPSLRTGEPYSNYTNPTLDRMMEEARKEFDAERRKKLYSKLLHLIRDDAPWLFLYQQHDLYGMRSRVMWSPRADEVIWIPEVSLR